MIRRRSLRDDRRTQSDVYVECPITGDAYLSEQWLDDRRRARWFLGLAACAPLIVAAVVGLDDGVWRVPADVVEMAWLVALSVATMRFQFFPCPNCGKPFGFKYFNVSPLWERKCMHRGLPKWPH